VIFFFNEFINKFFVITFFVWEKFNQILDLVKSPGGVTLCNLETMIDLPLLSISNKIKNSKQ